MMTQVGESLIRAAKEAAAIAKGNVMKLSIRRIVIQGEAKLALFDSSGVMLPDQRDVTIDQPFNGSMTVTVTFLLGGNVTLSGEPGHLG